MPRIGRAALLALALPSVGLAQAPAKNGLTAVAGLKVGHHTLAARPTGCTAARLGGPGRPRRAGTASAALPRSTGRTGAALVAATRTGGVSAPAAGRGSGGGPPPAGARLADARTLVRSGALLRPTRPGQNT